MVVQIDVVVRGEGGGEVFVDDTAPGRAVYEDEWWVAGGADACPADLEFVGGGFVREGLGEGVFGWHWCGSDEWFLDEE